MSAKVPKTMSPSRSPSLPPSIVPSPTTNRSTTFLTAESLVCSCPSNITLSFIEPDRSTTSSMAMVSCVVVTWSSTSCGRAVAISSDPNAIERKNPGVHEVSVREDAPAAATLEGTDETIPFCRLFENSLDDPNKWDHPYKVQHPDVGKLPVHAISKSVSEADSPSSSSVWRAIAWGSVLGASACENRACSHCSIRTRISLVC